MRPVSPTPAIALALSCSLSLLGCAASPLSTGAVLRPDSELTLAPQTGAVRLSFPGESGTLATKSDIRQLRVTLSGSSLAAPLAQTLPYPAGAATFKDLAEGSLTLSVEALASSGAVIGKATKSGIAVLAGQLTTVTIQLKLDPTAVAPGTGLVGVGVVIEDGDLIPLPAPSASPTPAPTPTSAPISTPTPSPVSTPSPEAASALYVSPSGSDSHPGTAASPLKTLTAAASKAKPGTTVLIAPGTYHEQLVTRVAGTSTAPITFRSHGGKVVIDGSQLSWTAGSNQNQGLVELKHSHVVLDGLTITNSKNSGVILNADHLTVRNCEVSYTQRHAISTYTGRQTAAGGTMIRQTVLEGNDVHHGVLKGAGNGQAISLIADGFVVRGNRVRDNVTEGIDVWLGARHGEVVGNEVYGNGAPGIYVDGGTFLKIHRNRVYANAKGGIGVSSEDSRYATRDVWIVNNLVTDHAADACFVWDPDTGAQNVLFAHNTLVNNRKAFYFAGSGNTVQVFNNLGHSTQTSLYDDSKNSTIAQGNNVWLSSVTGFVSASSQDFRLSAGSPAINAGRVLTAPVDDLGTPFRLDVDVTGGVRANGAPDAGAYEF